MTFNPDDLRLMAGLGQQEQKEYKHNLLYNATPMSKQTIEALKRCVDELEPSAFKDGMYEFIKRKRAYETVMFNNRPENIQLLEKYNKILNEKIARAELAQQQAKRKEKRGMFSKIFTVFNEKFNPFARISDKQDQQESILMIEQQEDQDIMLRKWQKSKKTQ